MHLISQVTQFLNLKFFYLKRKENIKLVLYFLVLCQVRINSIPIEDQSESVVFINGFFLDIDNILVCASNGFAYLYMLPDKLVFL
jgi:hypothetical protein